MPDATAVVEAPTPEPPAKPKYQVVGDTFIAQSEEGEIRVRLRFKTKLIRAIRNAGDELDQFIALLDGIGDKRALEQIDELDIFDTQLLVTEFFKAFEQRQAATVGEAQRSSN